LSLFYENGFSKRWELFLVFIFPFLFRNRDKRDKGQECARKGGFEFQLSLLSPFHKKEFYKRRGQSEASLFSFLFFLLF